MIIGVPLLFNATLPGILMAWVNAKFDGIGGSIDAKFAVVDKRFDDMRDLWRAELHRVEEILDARLKHIAERR